MLAKYLPKSVSGDHRIHILSKARHIAREDDKIYNMLPDTYTWVYT